MFLALAAVVLAFMACEAVIKPVDNNEQNVTFTVTFNANGGSGTVPSAQTVSSGKGITLPGDNGLSKSGSTFGGWNTLSDGTGTNYNAGASYTVTGNATLYAKWNAPDKYKDFYNYPNGRQDQSGTLRIENTVNQPVLLFTSSVDPNNYIGTADSLNSIKVTLPEEKFYTIVAVIKRDYEDNSEQAGRFSDLTYFSRTQPYTLKVRSNGMFGGGRWIINNPTNYWVSFKKSDGSGTVFAVAAPHTTRVTVPVQLNTNYDYVPHFYKELKFEGVIVALVEFDDQRAADTVRATTQTPQFNTDVGGMTQPSTNIKPAIYLTNSCDKTVRAYFGQNNQLGNGADTDNDFALASGASMLFTGLETGVASNSINFASIAWSNPSRVSVSQNMTMAKNKVYKIVLSGSINGGGGNTSNYSTTIEEVDAEDFFDDK